MAESLAEKKARARKIVARLDRAYPDARTELRFSTPLELLVATILSAQCTDERVNAVTALLFPRYRSAQDWASVALPDLEREIHSTGFFRAKARSIVGMAKALVGRPAAAPDGLAVDRPDPFFYDYPLPFDGDSGRRS